MADSEAHYPIGIPEDDVLLPDIELWSKHMAKAPKAQTEDDCRSSGGSWEKQGMEQEWGCVFRTPDAGKVCSDDSQCSLLCLPDKNSRWGQQSRGVCKNRFELFGCIGGMKEGLPTGVICRD